MCFMEPNSWESRSFMTGPAANQSASAASRDWSVLCVDDDPVIQILLSEVVRTAGARYTQATSAQEAEELLDRRSFDLVLLDRRLPDGDGLLLLRSTHEVADCPVIVLSELSGSRERMLGLGLGAVDYIVKPFSATELSSRVRYILTEKDRERQTANASPVEVGRIRLVPASRELSIDGRVVFLPPAEARLLQTLMEAANKVQTRDRLTLKACGREWCLGDRTVDVLIARLRKKIPTDVARIVTIHGSGYLLTVN